VATSVIYGGYTDNLARLVNSALQINIVKTIPHGLYPHSSDIGELLPAGDYIWNHFVKNTTFNDLIIFIASPFKILQ
jgi:hypothetical protein